MAKRMTDISVNAWVVVMSNSDSCGHIQFKRAKDLTHDDFGGNSIVSGPFKTLTEAEAWEDKTFIDEYVLGDD